jgi:dihydroorotate dehydrogenase
VAPNSGLLVLWCGPQIGASRSGAVLSKSATVLKQVGNPFPRYKELELGSMACIGSINSEGLPNSGIDYYLTDAACTYSRLNQAQPFQSDGSRARGCIKTAALYQLVRNSSGARIFKKTAA